MLKGEKVYASRFVNLPTIYREKLVKTGGIIPINDKFFDFFGSREKLILIYGSYGNGKSKFLAQDLIEKCRTETYFKCFYGRKVLKDVRTSSFDELASEIEARGLEYEFRYSRSDNSTMVITHKNGNRFIPFGADDSKSLKSIKDATCIWCEEFDQFTQKDFGFLFSRLRTERANLQFYGTFNSEPLITRHWLREQFFDNKIEHDLKPLKIFGTYKDNYFIDKVDYEQKLRLIANGRDHVFQAIAEGWFGVTVNKNPFFYSYMTKHFIDGGTEIDMSLYLDISFDFNKIPCSAVIGQYNEKDYTFKIVDVILSDSNTEAGKSALASLCGIIKRKYILSGMFVPYRIRVTGDASGSNMNADTVSKLSFYATILRELGVYESQLFKRCANPAHDFNGQVINYLLYTIKDGNFINGNVLLNNDINQAYKDDKNSLNEAKDKLGLHIVDAWRYLMDFWLCRLGGSYTNNYKRISENIDYNNKRTNKNGNYIPI